MSAKVTLLGRITEELVLKKTKNGKDVLNFTLACRLSNKTTGFYDVTAWGMAAENIAKFSGKGKKLQVEGELRENTYESNGTKHTNTFINLEGFEFCSDRSKDEGEVFEDQFPVSLFEDESN